MRRIAPGLLLLATLSCAPTETKPPVAIREIETREYVKVPVFYGTTRKVDHADRVNVYGRERGRLQYGVGWVSIPRVHEPGELEEPSLQTLTIREDPKKHVVLISVGAIAKERWFADLNTTIADARMIRRSCSSTGTTCRSPMPRGAPRRSSTTSDSPDRPFSSAGRLMPGRRCICSQNEGTFFFSRLIYTDVTARPIEIEFGVRKTSGELWLEIFENTNSG